MEFQFKITFKSGTKTVAEIEGRENNPLVKDMTIREVTEGVLQTEQFLEQLTGLRVHIEQIA
ncbi:hypothetical protein UFOVP1196_6 [uncultured Caudovirales phage]|uniref:Uncharacterized protein n=1 Tax=uncultured Caudovirales phage TaxID=2100421 RepID=A0A6J5R4M9_9CAUD|nr:hypothetical protein UFOVP1196_6 [uncultured Caudovirales phage]